MMHIVFVCLGNICRSPMAEAIMKNLVCEKKLDDFFDITSRATSMEEAGNNVYPRALEKLEEKGVKNFSHQATVFQREEYNKFDYIVVMEDQNIASLLQIVGSDPQKKIRKLIPNHNILDPWYTRNFEKAYQDIYKGCTYLLEEILSKRRGEE